MLVVNYVLELRSYIAIAKSAIDGFHATLQAVGCHVSCKDFASPRDLTDRSLLLHEKGFLGKSEGSLVSSCITNDQLS